MTPSVGEPRLSQQTDQFRFSLVAESERESICGALSRGARTAANELGITLRIHGPQASDAGAQAALVREAARGAPDCILIAPVTPDNLIPLAQEAGDADIPVITVRAGLENDAVIAHVGADDHRDGRLAARAIVEALGEQGRVLIVGRDPANMIAAQRLQGIEAVFSAYSGIDLVGTDEIGEDQLLTAEQMVSTFEERPDLAGVMTLTRSAFDASTEAVATAGMQGSVWLIGFGADPTQVDALRDDLVNSLVIPHSFAMGEVAVRLAHEYLISGDAPVPNRVWINSSVMTRDSIDDPVFEIELDAAMCAEVPGSPSGE
ncbi:MAG: substrate-binding domain-containing protein [Chloroflexota bacterium]|nr:substrate-binding domain-containing protein [Chloroflexota bacterium]